MLSDFGNLSAKGPDEIVDVYKRSSVPAFARGLFAAACEERDRSIGDKPWWSAGVSAILPCELPTMCTYCTFFIKRATPVEDIVSAAKTIASLGIRHMHLSGGTRLADETVPGSGYDREILEIVQAIQKDVDIDIEVNVGPSLTRSGVRALKDSGVTAITSSLEVRNEELFKKFKPGDSLKGRIRLMELCEEEGVPIRSMMMVGLGETDEDRIDHLIFLKQFKMLSHLRLSRYMPFETASAGGVRCSPWPVARLIAIARLMFPSIDLGLAAGNSTDDLILWRLAGGGNQILGASASMRGQHKKHNNSETRIIEVSETVCVTDKRAIIARYLGELGLVPTATPSYV